MYSFSPSKYIVPQKWFFRLKNFLYRVKGVSFFNITDGDFLN